jgi:hypothetical protein
MESASFQIPPFFIEVDEIPVTIIEVLKTTLISGETWYHVVVQINYKGIKSRRYTLDVKSEQDLINKLKIEITKIKVIEYTHGLPEVRRLIT